MGGWAVEDLVLFARSPGSGRKGLRFEGVYDEAVVIDQRNKGNTHIVHRYRANRSHLARTETKMAEGY